MQISLKEDRRDFLVGARDGEEGNTGKRKKRVKVCEDNKKVKENYNSNRQCRIFFFFYSIQGQSQGVTS